MKNFTKFLFAAVAVVIGLAVGACTPEPEPTPSAAVKVDVAVASVTPNGATIAVVTKGISEFAYMVDTELPAAAILAGDNKVTIADVDVEKSSEVVLQGLDPLSTHTVYFAFRKSDNGLYKDVVKVEFTTTTYSETITVMERKYDGYYLNVVVPQEVKERGNALRYATASLPMFNMAKLFNGTSVTDMLLYNAGQHILDDAVIRYDEYYNYERDEEGNLVDEGASFSDPMVPGQPNVFIIGEYEYMDNPEERIAYVDGEIITVYDATYDYNTVAQDGSAVVWYYPAGWNPGYYRPYYDFAAWVEGVNSDDYDSEDYWLGYYNHLQINTLEPETLAGGVDIDIYDLKPINACVSFTPTEDVAFYVVMILEEADYQANVLPLLDNNEEYLRWFTGSYVGMYLLGSETCVGNTEFWLSDWFTDMKGMQGKDIRVMVASMGDNEGTVQGFDTLKFTLPVATKPAPEVIVTPVETADPYVATFNIRCPNGDADEVYFACDYVREFDAALKETTYLDLLKSLTAANMLTANEVEAVNSPDGFMYRISSRENTTSRLAVLVYNDEGTSNNPNEAGSTAIAEVTTPNANFPTRVNSELFTLLTGEWEASAPMKTYVVDTDAEGNQTGSHWEDSGTYTSNVTISGGVEYPETLPQDVYDLYAQGGYDRDAVDALYEEFVALAEQYNARTRGFNRLLCLGFNFASPDYMLDMVATPYDLFIAEDYSASKISHMFYDFGPKWNLEIDANGNVWLPLDINKEYPLEAFNFGLSYTFYMLAVGSNYYVGAPLYNNAGQLVLDSRFPVEVSDDYNTLTIKPIVYTDSQGNTDTFYPCVAQLQYGMATPLNPRVAGEIVLRRKGASTSSAEANAPVRATRTAAVSSMGEAPQPVERTFTMTQVETIDVITRERVVPAQKMERGTEAFLLRARALYEAAYGVSLE